MAWFDFELQDSPHYRSIWALAFVLTVFSTFVTLGLISKHLSSYRQPQRQRRIVRILWMVPVYAIDSFLSLMVRVHEVADC